jgi:hypothetical protein
LEKGFLSLWNGYLVEGGFLMEEFLARVFKDGKVTIPKRLRSFCGVGDGDYVRLVLVEVLRKNDVGGWEKRKVGVEENE